MTSTEYNIGLTNSKKSSSRVLKPPGGGHSNIFEPVDKTVNNPRPKYDQQNSSNINFCVNSTDPNMLVEQLKHEVVKTSSSEVTTSAATTTTIINNNNNNNNNKTDDVKAASSFTSHTSRAETTSNGSSNNSNNEGVRIGAQQPQQPPKAGRVPPGGFSSGLW